MERRLQERNISLLHKLDKMKEKKEEKKNEKKEVEDIEVIIGDNSILEISDVGDCMNDLRPKDSSKNKKHVIIPQSKKDSNKK